MHASPERRHVSVTHGRCVSSGGVIKQRCTKCNAVTEVFSMARRDLKNVRKTKFPHSLFSFFFYGANSNAVKKLQTVVQWLYTISTSWVTASTEADTWFIRHLQAQVILRFNDERKNKMQAKLRNGVWSLSANVHTQCFLFLYANRT